MPKQLTLDQLFDQAIAAAATPAPAPAPAPTTQQEPEPQPTITRTHDQAPADVLAAVQAAERGDARFRARGTCQICQRVQALKTTRSLTLVLHGYERPGFGYILGNCQGTGVLPYELSCEATKEWHALLAGKVLPDAEAALVRIRSRPYTAHKIEEKIRRGKTACFTVLRGQPIPEEHKRHVPSYYGDPIYESQWETWHKNAIWQAEQRLKAIAHDVAFLADRIAKWRYAPEKLVPAEPIKPQTASQEVKEWFADQATRTAMLAAPSPGTFRIVAANFWEWTQRFPRTLAWVAMRTGNRTPSYYQAVREAWYAHLGKAAPLLGKSAEAVAAKQAKLTEKAAKEKAKVERANQATIKAQGDCQQLLDKLHRLMQHGPLVEYLARTPFFYAGDEMLGRPSKMSTLERLLGMAEQWGYLRLLEGREPVEKPGRDYSALRRELRGYLDYLKQLASEGKIKLP